MKKLLLCFALLVLLQPAFATSIVILITPDYILLGTDSRRTITDYDTNKSTHLSTCKIRNFGEYCYVMAGLIASENPNYSADSIVLKTLASNKNYEVAINTIKVAITAALKAELKNRRKTHPTSFAEIIASKEPILELAILRMKDGKPFVEITGFQISNKKTLAIKTYMSSASPNASLKENKMYMLGQYSGMEAYLKETQTSDPVSLIDQMISIQSQTTPSTVAKPINIIKYSTSGVEWLQ